ncbi:MAG TPA: hypothetical protein VFQ77_03805 [Pseudonocardiaceae bacterium]|jgi:hypothetical protein|nr:hypothetical protein [Pseudonocardiaceae bacterium]
MSRDDSTVLATALDVAIADLFDLDVQTEGVADLDRADRSADCTNNGCTESCLSCGCR